MSMTHLSSSQMLEALVHWPHWSTVELVVRREYALSALEFQTLLPEYQKFLVLASQSPGMGMFSSQVDKLWHAHVLCLRLYETFCSQYFGRLLYHTPNLRQSSRHDCSTPEDICNDKDCGVCKTDPGKCTEGECEEEDARAEYGEGGDTAATAAGFLAAYRNAFGEPPAHVWAVVRNHQEKQVVRG
jgi:hypothetical protein